MMEVEPATTTQQQNLKFSSPITTSSITKKSIDDSKMGESDVIAVLSPPSSPGKALAATRESVITQQSSVAALANSQPNSTQSTSSKDSLSREAIELIQNEFVRLKAGQLGGTSNESSADTPAGVVDIPQTVPSVVLTSIQDLGAHCSPVVTMATTGEGGQLVYCNVNDLDLASAGEATVVEPGYNMTSLASLAEASQTIQHQVLLIYNDLLLVLHQKIFFLQLIKIKQKNIYKSKGMCVFHCNSRVYTGTQPIDRNQSPNKGRIISSTYILNISRKCSLSLGVHCTHVTQVSHF